MLFIVPDGGDAPAAPKKSPAVKVELDLDDAPFLEDAAPEPPKSAPSKAEGPNDPVVLQTRAPATFADRFRSRIALFYAGLRARKKLIALAGGGLVLLLALAIAADFFFFNAPEPPPPPPPPVAVNATEPAPDPEYTYTFDPFMVEIRGTEGEIHFLQCSFSIITKNQVLKTELEVKTVVLRDAIHYYLSHRSLAFLTDPRMAEQRKVDLINVINEHVSAEKIDNLHFQDFLISRPKP